SSCARAPVRCCCCFFLLDGYRQHLALHSFPTRRSSDLDAGQEEARHALLRPVLARVGDPRDRRPAAARVPDPVLLGRCVPARGRSEEHTSELQSRENLVCRLLLEKKKEERTEKI